MSLVSAYNPLDISFTHGHGVWLFDAQKNKYLDTFSGIAVCGLGHAHPEITKTIQNQAAKLLHTSNMVRINEQIKLAEKLTALSDTQQVFFTNSGAEANETAIKLTRLYGHKKNIETPSIIVMEKAFHGRTMATLTASGSRKVQAGYEPLVPGFIRAAYNDIKAIRTIAENRDDIVAIMLEPILGEGGIVVADEIYLREVEALCRQNKWLLILDEIQTGNGRTGKWFGFMHAKIKPDIITIAKGLGNGIPIGACLMRNEACDLLMPGNHGSTFGGNPLSCATALTVLNIIEKNNLCEHVTKLSIALRQTLQDRFDNHPNITAIRGKGFMIGIEFDKPIQNIRNIGLKHGLLLNVTAERVLRLLPPLIISEEEIEYLIEKLSKTIADWEKS